VPPRDRLPRRPSSPARRALAAGAGLLALACGVARADDGFVTLANGLRLATRPVAGTSDVAVVVLYEIGEGHDPEGRSGLGHLVEHVLVTAPALAAPRRTLEETRDRYARGFRAHTGEDATVIGVVAPRERLEAELAELAARMADLRPEEGDLARERANIADELGAMYERTPPLVAGNRARDMVFPPAPGARRGGTLEGLAAVDAALVRARLARFYRPANAIVVLAGAIEPAAALARARALFEPIPTGERPPAPRRPEPAAAPGSPLEVALASDPERPRARALARPLAAAALAAPRPDDPDFAPYLLLVTRLAVRGLRARVQLRFAPLEDARVATLSTEEGSAAIGAFLAAAVPEVARGAPSEAEAEVAASLVLGNDREMAELEAAFRPAVARHLGIEAAALRRALGRVGGADLARAARAWLDPARAGVVVVREAAPENPR
jgi:zinc protease